MNFLTSYFNIDSQQRITVSDQQGSRFAKEIAGDFNPIHNEGSKRFCVPGDLLFAIALNRYGLFASMQFNFLGMLGANASVRYSSEAEIAKGVLQLLNSNDKQVLDIQATGEQSQRPENIEQLVRNYVRFSGQNFPHILVPLMKKHGVMINPARPLVIYESMAFELDDINADNIDLTLDNSTLEVNGKRGNATLFFSLQSDGKNIGHGEKKLVLSGLREYDEKAITELSDSYLASRDSYQRAEA
jgi:hypothetical protein